MINLAGRADCDNEIRRELSRCGIEIVEAADPCGREVNARLTGRLGAFTFTRAWYYWVVNGPTPLDVARRLYAHPVGKTDIRVAGHCGCPPPEDPWITYRDAEGVEITSDPEGKQERQIAELAARHPDWDWPKHRFVPNAAAVAATATVDSYHIDSELGLYLFARSAPDAGRTAESGGGEGADVDKGERR